MGWSRPARFLGVLLRAHDEDFARIGGYLASTASARTAIEERLVRRLWHRLPWLVIGLAGAAFSVWLVGLFDAQLSADVRSRSSSPVSSTWRMPSAPRPRRW